MVTYKIYDHGREYKFAHIDDARRKAYSMARKDTQGFGISYYIAIYKCDQENCIFPLEKSYGEVYFDPIMKTMVWRQGSKRVKLSSSGKV